MFIMDVPPEAINEAPVLMARVDGCAGEECRNARPGPRVFVTQGEAIVFTVDIPDLPQQYANVMVAQANQAQASASNEERAVGTCQAIDYNWSGKNGKIGDRPRLSASIQPE